MTSHSNQKVAMITTQSDCLISNFQMNFNFVIFQVEAFVLLLSREQKKQN